MSRGIHQSFGMRFSRVAGGGTLAALIAVGLVTAAHAAGDAAKGKVIFTTNCASCHGEGGKGDGPVGAALNPHPRDFTEAKFMFDAAQTVQFPHDRSAINALYAGGNNWR